VLSAEDAVALYSLIESRGIQLWVVGGWGVDALVARVTRSHKDLDVLVSPLSSPPFSRMSSEPTPSALA
jgi:lincosamide nucleotidyltransferase A/C/D/E